MAWMAFASGSNSGYEDILYYLLLIILKAFNNLLIKTYNIHNLS